MCVCVCVCIYRPRTFIKYTISYVRDHMITMINVHASKHTTYSTCHVCKDYHVTVVVIIT